MALSTYGKLTFKVRLTPVTGINSNLPLTYTVTVVEASHNPDPDVSARASAVAQAGWGSSNVGYAEIWLIANDAI